jgi:hypothetical protein
MGMMIKCYPTSRQTARLGKPRGRGLRPTRYAECYSRTVTAISLHRYYGEPAVAADWSG